MMYGDQVHLQDDAGLIPDVGHVVATEQADGAERVLVVWPGRKGRLWHRAAELILWEPPSYT